MTLVCEKTKVTLTLFYFNFALIMCFCYVQYIGRDTVHPKKGM